MREAGAKFIALYRFGVPANIGHQSEQYIKELRLQCDEQLWNDGTFNDAVARMRKIIVDIIDA